MATQAGSTSDLYLQQDGSDRGQIAHESPPAVPPPAPPPSTPQPQPPTYGKRRMADERPDGSTRDTSVEALRPGNDLGFREFDPDHPAPAETDGAAAETKPAPVETKAPDAGTQPPAQEPPKEASKLLAGKYKTVEELEKAYAEANASFTRASQKAAELEKQQLAKPPEPPRQPSAAELAVLEAQRQEFINKFVANPEGVVREYVDKAAQQTVVALSTQELIHKWRTENPDLAPYEGRVGYDMGLLAQSNPELLKTPEGLRQLFADATKQFREFAGHFRTEGAKEANTVETRVIPLVTNTARPTATENPSSKAPLSADEAFNLHMQMLRAEERRTHKGLRR